MEWQPIETAPKDGRFLVYGGTWACDWSGIYKPSNVVLVRIVGAEFYVADNEYYSPEIENPTHWMPLPPPPKDGA